jgi:hypothetical protein
LFRRRIISKPTKPTIVIAAAGLGVAVAASSAAAVTWPAGASAHAATTADYVPSVSHDAGAATASPSRTVAQLQVFRAEAAWQYQLNASAAAARAAARQAARQAAARAAHRAVLLAAQRRQTQPAAPHPARPAPAPAQPTGSPQRIAMAMLGSYGWSTSQFSCLDALWSHESGWSVTAQNPDGAYGIAQAMPGSKMASAGPDWQTDATTQIRWGLGYIKGLYGSPCGAWSHEEATGWY